MFDKYAIWICGVQLCRGPGVVVLTLSWVITFFTLWQMVEMHEMVPGKRFDRYHELGQQAFGKKLGLWIVIPQQLLVEVSVDIVYMVTGGQALRYIYILNCNGDHHHCPLKPSSTEIKTNPYAMTSHWILIYGSVHFLFVQIPNFNSIAGISLAAAIMSVSYSTIAWTIPIFHNEHNQHRDIANHTLVNVTADYDLPKASTTGHVLSAFNALGVVAFAYAGHNVVLEIQATLRSRPGRPSKIAMWRGVSLAYVIVTICYFPVALVCYWAYGNQLAADSNSNSNSNFNSNILQFEGFRGITTAANFMVIIHILGSYQIYAMPVFDMLETVLMKKWLLAPSFKLRLITRSTYVGITMVVATIIPFFQPLLGFFGGFAYAPTTYFLPCCIWLAVYKPKRFSASWTINWICIILGVLLMLTATIGGGSEIVKEWHTYEFKDFW
jgi:amino acid permease